jgi:ATP-binding cassette subfamily F protein uup
VRDVLADGSDWIDVRGVRKHVQGYLKEFLFDPALIEARIGSLSGGEQSRILLAREFAREANLLVLDEPTNDLDLETLDLLQEVIADYDGTVLIVSHDRDFLDGLVTKVFEFGNKRVKEHFEDIKGFLALKKMENLREIELKTGATR